MERNSQKIYNLSFVTHIGRQSPQVSTVLYWADRLGHWKARWGIGRMKYVVEPGLYAIGNPDGNSPVFVSANYKMSFDRLRSQLDGRDGWILVLDTKGINVWCAAGKGTFGTDELVKRIEAVKLDRIVNHRTLIVPQLGATGVSAHEVKQQSDFRVVYGPAGLLYEIGGIFEYFPYEVQELGCICTIGNFVVHREGQVH